MRWDMFLRQGQGHEQKTEIQRHNTEVRHDGKLHTDNDRKP